jgi:hypothetical protein
MPGMWIANGGAFQKLKKAWVSVNGVFQPVKDVDVALDGQFRDSGVGATPIMQAFYATLGVNAHVALSVTWSVSCPDFDPGSDGVVVYWNSRDGRVKGQTDLIPSLSGTTDIVVGYPNSEWSLQLWARIDSQDYYMGQVPSISTAGVPTPTNPTLAAVLAPDHNSAIATMNWASVPYADSYTLVRYYNGASDVVAVPQPGTALVWHEQAGLKENTPIGYYIRAIVKGTESFTPAYIGGRTPSDYVPGWYEVDAQQKRTLVTGDKRVNRQWRPESDDKIYHGHGGDWNNYGTQVGFIFYWSEQAPGNPFFYVLNAIQKGGRCTRVQMRVNRAGDGFNVPIRPIIRTHVYKWWPGDGNTNGNMHSNWHRANPSIDVGSGATWVDLDPGIVPLLTNNNGNGIAIGSTADKQADYMAFWKSLTGKLRFQIE